MELNSFWSNAAKSVIDGLTVECNTHIAYLNASYENNISLVEFLVSYDASITKKGLDYIKKMSGENDVTHYLDKYLLHKKLSNKLIAKKSERRAKI